MYTYMHIETYKHTRTHVHESIFTYAHINKHITHI